MLQKLQSDQKGEPYPVEVYRRCGARGGILTDWNLKDYYGRIVCHQSKFRLRKIIM